MPSLLNLRVTLALSVAVPALASLTGCATGAAAGAEDAAVPPDDEAAMERDLETSADASTVADAAPSPDVGAFLGCAGLPLCDDFEGVAAGAAPDPLRWTVATPNCSGTGALSVDGTVAHGGTRSLRIAGRGGYCNHTFVRNTSAFATLGVSAVYGRFYLRIDGALGAGHATFMAMKDDNDGGKDLRFGGQNMVLDWNRESDDATLPALSPMGVALSLAPKPGTWQCVEFLVDQLSGTMQTWVDGAEVPGLHEDGVPTPDIDQQWLQSRPAWRPKLTDLRLGWESYAGQDLTLWFDDVALSSTRIGCL